MSPKSEIRAILERCRSALLISHVNPDGDTLGAALALAWALRGRGMVARLSCADPIPTALQFMPGAAGYGVRSRTDEDCVISVDAADLPRMGEVYDAARDGDVPLLVIDHHVTNPCYGTVNFVDERTSTAELVLELIDYLGITIDETIATCLMTGLVTDTQGFRTSNTSASTFETAGRLVVAGADVQAIMRAAFKQRTVESLAVWGQALAGARFETGILWASITRDMMSGNGSREDTVSGLVSLLATVEAARIAAVFHQIDEDHVEVGLRSVPGVDVAVVARRFGGGGHPQASGFTASGVLEKVAAALLPALREAASATDGGTTDIGGDETEPHG